MDENFYIGFYTERHKQDAAYTLLLHEATLLTNKLLDNVRAARSRDVRAIEELTVRLQELRGEL